MKTVALLSGGLDSAVAMAMVKNKGDEIYCLNIYYGQKHAREIESADALAKYYGIPLESFAITIPCYSALTDPQGDVNEELENHLPASFVPGRNMIMLAYAASYAYSIDAGYIVGGWNQIDYPGYPDCRPKFLESMQMSISLALDKGIAIFAPLINMTKKEIITEGVKLNVPFDLTWSCYEGRDEPCGICSSCRFREDGFKQAGIIDSLL